MERKSEIETYILWNYVDERFVENVEGNFVEFTQGYLYNENSIHNNYPVTWKSMEDGYHGIPVGAVCLPPVFPE